MKPVDVCVSTVFDWMVVKINFSFEFSRCGPFAKKQKLKNEKIQTEMTFTFFFLKNFLQIVIGNTLLQGSTTRLL